MIVLGGNLFKSSTEQIETERRLRATQALAGSIAHEMRHPLSRLKQSLQRIHQALPPTGQGAQLMPARNLGELYDQLAEGDLAVKRGLQVIAMTLDEVSAKPMDAAAFTDISAAEVVRKAVQEYGYDSEEERAAVDVRIVDDFSFRGDETACLFVLFNLIKNALYYLPRYPDMRVTVTVERNAVRVHDSGPGIPKEALAHLFEPFKSVGKAGGTGLGLAYCDRVMRAFGGEIGCASVVGESTEFTLRFPPADAEDVRLRQTAFFDAVCAMFDGRRILVVDDDAVQRLVTHHKLQPLPARIDEAANGNAALDLAYQHRYDLVLLDLNMPGLDGHAVAQRLRAGHGATPSTVPIVAYTAEPAHVAAGKARKSGMDGYVAKPSTQLALLQAMREALERPRLAAAADEALHGRCVLLVDDAAWNRKAVAGYLRQAGVTVTQAAHGEEALRRLSEAPVWDAVIMDINMPGMNGLEATSAIRRGGGRHASVPVIGLTAHSDPALIEEARKAGMNDFLTKPVDTELLRHILLRWTRTARAEPVPADPQAAKTEPVRPLLDAERLETYRRIGLYDDLIGDYLPAMTRVVDQLQASAAGGDMDATLQALHSLLGMSGEAGATALHQLVRRIYVPMLEHKRWPEGGSWPEQIRRLATQTDEALRAYSP
ncbi:MAG: response regulator [Pseudomonadota bacterium]